MEGGETDWPKIRRFEINDKEKLIFSEKKLSLEIIKFEKSGGEWLERTKVHHKIINVTLLFKAFENNEWVIKDDNLCMHYDNAYGISSLSDRLKDYGNITLIDEKTEDDKSQTIIVDIGNWKVIK